MTEIAWEDAVQGLGMTMSTVASEKTGNVVYWQRVLQTVTSLRVVSLVGSLSTRRFRDDGDVSKRASLGKRAPSFPPS